MKSKTNFAILLLSSLLFSFTSFGQTSSASNSDAKPIVSSSSASNSNIKENSDKAQSQNKKSQGISQIIGVANMGLGAMYAAECSSQNYGACAQAALHFVMGAMSFQQAGANGKAAGQAGATGYDTSATNPFGDPGAEINHLDPNVDSTKDKNLSGLVNTKKLNEIKRDLMGPGIGGVKMDSKGIITTPDGKTYDSNQLTDKAAMAKAGFSDSAIDAALAANSAFEKAAIKKMGGADTVGIGAATAENGFSDGGGGAKYGSASSMDQRSGGGYADKSRNPANTNKIAGLTKNFNGERIGVAAENIFNMMTRRYKTKEKQDAFFDPSELIPLTQ